MIGSIHPLRVMLNDATLFAVKAANHPPSLAPVADQMIPVGGSVTVTLQGSDADGAHPWSRILAAEGSSEGQACRPYHDRQRDHREQQQGSDLKTEGPGRLAEREGERDPHDRDGRACDQEGRIASGPRVRFHGAWRLEEESYLKRRCATRVSRFP